MISAQKQNIYLLSWLSFILLKIWIVPIDNALLRFNPEGMIAFEDKTLIVGSRPCHWSLDLVFLIFEPKVWCLQLLLNCSQIPQDKVLYLWFFIYRRQIVYCLYLLFWVWVYFRLSLVSYFCLIILLILNSFFFIQQKLMCLVYALLRFLSIRIEIH